MAKISFDGLIEAVHYSEYGQIEWVRAYERRGATFSDVVLIQRAELVSRLKKGLKFATGQRKEFMGSTFGASKAVRLVNPGDIITNNPNTSRDQLEDVPLI